VYSNLYYSLFFKKSFKEYVSPSYSRIYDAYRLHIRPFAVPWLAPLTQISITASTYLTLATSIDRYMAICRPFSSAARSTDIIGLNLLG